MAKKRFVKHYGEDNGWKSTGLYSEDTRYKLQVTNKMQISRSNIQIYD